MLSMKELKPTTVACFLFIYNPICYYFAISLGKDELSLVKIGSAVLIFGVYLVSSPASKGGIEKHSNPPSGS
jgi:hypothetical protein